MTGRSEAEDSTRGVSIRRALLARFAGLILLTFAIFSGGLYFFVLAPAAEQLAESEMLRAEKEIESTWLALVGQIERVVLTARQWGVDGDLDLQDHQNFTRRFLPLLTHRPQVSAAMLADDKGREFLLLKMDDNQYASRITDRERWGSNQRWMRPDAQGKLLREEWRASDYNPLQRPWHIGAMSIQKDPYVYWSEPYIFHTSQNPGITASSRWCDATGASFIRRRHKTVILRCTP